MFMDDIMMKVGRQNSPAHETQRCSVLNMLLADRLVSCVPKFQTEEVHPDIIGIKLL